MYILSKMPMTGWINIEQWASIPTSVITFLTQSKCPAVQIQCVYVSLIDSHASSGGIGHTIDGNTMQFWVFLPDLAAVLVCLLAWAHVHHVRCWWTHSEHLKGSQAMHSLLDNTERSPPPACINHQRKGVCSHSVIVTPPHRPIPMSIPKPPRTPPMPSLAPPAASPCPFSVGNTVWLGPHSFPLYSMTSLWSLEYSSHILKNVMAVRSKSNAAWCEGPMHIMPMTSCNPSFRPLQAHIMSLTSYTVGNQRDKLKISSLVVGKLMQDNSLTK